MLRLRVNRPMRPLFGCRWYVNVLTIACESCDHSWTVASGLSVFQRQAVESCPCPRCGAYTLCCQGSSEGSAVRRRARRGWVHQAGPNRSSIPALLHRKRIVASTSGIG